MRLQRDARRHESHRTAGVDSTLWWEHHPGDRVITVEGFSGVVTAVEDGPYPGAEHYLVTLDDGLGGGEYAPSELRSVEGGDDERTAKTAVTWTEKGGEGAGTYGQPRGSEWSASDGGRSLWVLDAGSSVHWEVSAPSGEVLAEGREDSVDAAKAAAESVIRTAKTSAWVDTPESLALSEQAAQTLTEANDAMVWEEDDEALHTASEDYPVLGEILVERPPLEHVTRLAARTAEVDEDTSISAVGGFWEKVLVPYGEGVYDRLPEHMKPDLAPGQQWSYDWCRFRKHSRCMYPKELNERATAIEGYAVWVPVDRGLCPRNTWDLQKACPVGEPGPNSGEPNARLDATIPWEEGGQRGGYAAALSARTDDHEFAWHFTAAWKDVRAKAKRIRSNNGVRITVAPTKGSSLYIVGEVKGETNIYETRIMRTPGRQSVALWECGCAWARYSWGRSGRWKRYEGRMCSHALALMYEAQARQMMTEPFTEDTRAPAWRTTEPVRPGDYAEANPHSDVESWRVGSLGEVADTAREVSTDPFLQRSPASRIAQALIEERTDPNLVLSWLRSVDATRAEEIVAEVMAMSFKSLMARVRGQVRRVLNVFTDGTAEVEGLGIVPVREITYPTFHPNLGLNPSDRGTYLGTKQAINRADDIPPEPGQSPIPSGTVRGFHVTPMRHLDSIRATGLTMSTARGTTYGEPNAVWFSGSLHPFADTEQVLVEAAIPQEWVEGGIGGPSSNFAVFHDVLPSMIVAIHEPWHAGYRYLADLREEVKAGEYDDFLDDPRYGKAIERIKREGAKYAQAERTGVMVALRPPDAVCEALTLEGGEPVEQLHVTLAYLGKVDEVDREALDAAVAEWAGRWDGVPGQIAGYGRFTNGEERVLYASVDAPGLDRARDDLIDTLADHGLVAADDHGFTPHLTLAYGDGVDMPDDVPEEAAEEFVFDTVVVAHGGQWVHYEFTTGEAIAGETVASVTSTEKKDPRFEGVGLKQDDDGKWYVHTHRARSDSYDTPEDIPQSDVDWIESTGAKAREPKPGMRFIHSRHLDRSNQPVEYVVSAVRGGMVYYKVPDQQGAGWKVSVEQFPESVAEWMDDTTASTDDAFAFEGELRDEPEAALPETTAEPEDDDESEGAPSARSEGSAGDGATFGPTSPIGGAEGPYNPESAAIESLDKEALQAGLGWLMADSSSPQQQARDASDIAQAAKAFLEGGQQALTAVAAKQFSPAEQAQIINEGRDVQAANLDLLDLDGTHYQAIEEALSGVEEDETWLV